MRNSILGLPSDDFDIATSMHPNEIKKLFKNHYDTGSAYGTVPLFFYGRKLEITTYRTEEHYKNHRAPEKVTFVSNLKDDLARRDFTINAIALGKDGTIEDPFGGQADLQNGIIRTVGNPQERFSEDALRMLRALRFSASLGFEIEAKTTAAIKENARLCAALSKERITAELEKILLSSAPEKAALAFNYGLLRHTVESGKEIDLSSLRAAKATLTLRLSLLCRLLQETGLIKTPAAFLASLSLSNIQETECTAICNILERIENNRVTIKKLTARYGTNAMEEALQLTKKETAATYYDARRKKECMEEKDLALQGRDLHALGLQGGKIGEALQLLLFHVHKHPQDNKAALLRALLSEKFGI